MLIDVSLVVPYSFVTEIHIAPLQGNYSQVFRTPCSAAEDSSLKIRIERVRLSPVEKEERQREAIPDRGGNNREGTVLSIVEVRAKAILRAPEAAERRARRP